MAIRTNEKTKIELIYKPEYDTEGNFSDLDAWSQTFNYINENATPQQLLDFANSIRDCTPYRDAPCRVKEIREAIISA